MADQNDRASYLTSRDPSIDRRFRPRPINQAVLFSDIAEEDSSHFNLTQTVSSCSGSSNNSNKTIDTASVYLRLRPAKKCEIYSYCRNVFKTKHLDAHTVQSQQHAKCAPEKHFEFTNVFNDTTKQYELYNSCVHSAIENEVNISTLTYGTSGSGKTYTLIGNQENPGIIPRAIQHLFTKYEDHILEFPCIKIDKGNIVILDEHNMKNEIILKRKLLAACGSEDNDLQKQIIKNEHNFSSSSNEDVHIWISFAEIYNELVYDLLADHGTGQKENPSSVKRVPLKVISNDGNAFIKNLTTVHVKSSLESLKLLQLGRSRVCYAATNINDHSSRSHCIFFVDVIKAKNNELTHVSYKFCDLAGSERLKKTDNIGNRLREAQSINNSLLVLGRCLDAVYHNQKKKTNDMVPIRDSKLTMLLQSSLLGKEKLTMVVNLWPRPDYFEENINVLNFASIAQQIYYKPVPKRTSERFSWFISAAASSSPKSSNISNETELLDENYK